MVAVKFRILFCVLFYLLVQSHGVTCQPSYFFLCNYHGSLDPLPLDSEELLLSISLDGNPPAYRPGATYTVRISSSEFFNGILVTGLFSSSRVKERIHPLSYGMTNLGFGQDNPVQSDFICGRLHSDISPYKTPVSETEFTWTAPAAGTGCVTLMATATLGMQIIFQDVIAYQICEEGQIETQSRPSLADIHSDGVILRDDFDSQESTNIWSQDTIGVSFDGTCGEITHDNAAVFCGQFPMRQLVTPSLNLTSATSIQFTTGTGSCGFMDVDVTLSYQLTSEWIEMRRLRVTRDTLVNIIHFPHEARSENVALKISQDDVAVGCWAMDNILIAVTENRPSYIYEDMNPIDASKWLFMPGSDMKGECMSHFNALVFSSSMNETGPNYGVTRDLDLSENSVAGEAPIDVEVAGGQSQPQACGHIDSTSTFAFSEAGRRQFCTTPSSSLENIEAVRFVLSMGSGGCHFVSTSSNVILTAVSESGVEELATFSHHAFRTPRQVTIPIPYPFRRANTVLCLEQGEEADDENVWAVDSFELVTKQTRSHHYVQFSINTQCDQTGPDTRVNVEYSNDFGKSWHLLQQPCYPETCRGSHWPYESVYQAGSSPGWRRVNLPLPAAALTDHTRFRWIQDLDDSDVRWAIDDIYIGTDEMCPGMCDGHGACFPDGCRCDVGWMGFYCNVSSQSLPSSLSIDFNYIRDAKSVFKEVMGGHIGYECGMLGTGKSLVFMDTGSRTLLTQPYNGTQIKFLQFAILMGRHSSVGTCQAPSEPGDGVLVHYTVNNGVTWQLLIVVPYNSERQVNVISVPIPQEGQVPGLQIRWMQANENAQGKAVWAIDDVILSSELYKSIYSTPKNYQKIYTTSVSFHTGILTDYCNRSNVLLFSPMSSEYVNTLRYAETQTMETSEGYVLEADINLQCDDLATSVTTYDPDHELLLQFSKDEGITWHLVQEENLPGSADEDSFHPASIYHLSEFTDWATTIIPMPRTTWSSHLRLRVIHNENSNAVWALNNVYMGPACPMHCRNRGRCRNGVCRCNADSIGPSCLSRTPLLTGVDDTFSNISNLRSKGWKVIGASVATKDKNDCGAMPSDQYLHFDKPGVRKLITPDIDTSLGGQIQFYIRISEDGCKVPRERTNGVLLQYSNNGGVTWKLLNELYYLDYTQPQYVHREIPEEAQTKQTRFRWWQPRNTGADQQPWSIGDVIVGEPLPLNEETSSEQTIKINGRRSSGDFPGSQLNPFILLANDGTPSDYCDPRFDSYVFTKTNGDRFATTNDYLLHTGDTIQFEINIGCTDTFSWTSPVQLEFSHDEGYSWDLVVRSCYPDGRPRSQMPYVDPDHDLSVHDCTGSARELTEPSVYYKGDHKNWQRVVIPVPRRVAARPVRLRWWQHVPNNSSAGVPAPWAIRSIYIGSSCHAYCNGHGRCELGHTCVCDRGYSGDHCQDVDSPQAGFWDHLTEGPNPDWWGNIIGITDEAGCGEVHEGEALYFGSEGTRKAETISLDTLSIRMIQFYIQIGTSDDSDTCSLPEERDEAVMLQYSNDNGITWKLIKELSFDSYSDHSKRVIANIPFAAKTPSTSFRWWQPLRDNTEHRSQWSLDDVFIGGPDLLSAGFADDFQAPLSETNWYRVRGGGIGNFTSCKGNEQSDRSALVVSSSEGVAETWDFRLNSGSFIQFDLIMNCESETPGNDVLSLEYSTDLGRSWSPVLTSCTPASSDCEQDFGSFFYAGLHQEWTRRIMELPEILTRSPQIRFRWIQHSGTVSWAIDNLYIGNGCPWMCSGHGRCWPNGSEDACRCDEGFEDLPHCEASITLDIDMTDTFDHPWNDSGNYRRVIGCDTDTASSLMINGENLIMGSKGIRLVETNPINTVDSQYIQFYIQFSGEVENISSALVLQSSRNGGITWSTIHLLYASSLPDSPAFIHVLLPAFARHDAVSFRLWQSSINSGASTFENGEAVWTLDNLYIGGRVSGCNSYVLEDGFESHSQETKHWLHDTHLTSEGFCNSSGNALVVEQNVGEHIIMTRDLCVSEGYMLQFKIAVGCYSSRLDEHSVRLEYSADHGITWNLLRDNCKGGDSESGRCNEQIYSSTVYYPGTSDGWRKITIPLSGFTCGSLRFRWYQGFYADNFESARSVTWAIDDVYIGPQCNQMCNGHGKCSNEGESCICDVGYGGETCCDIVTPNPTFFIETFDNEDGEGERRALKQWETLSGGEFSKDSKTCHETGVDIHQWGYRVRGPGERILETRDLDLRDADSVQFYLTYLHETGPVNINGGSESTSSTQPVTEFLHVQHSTDGGIVWRSLETIPFISTNEGELQYIALSLIEESRTNATRLRWWQPKKPTKNHYDFIIDQIVIAGPASSIDDHFDNETSHWVEMSGATIRPIVGSKCCPSASSAGSEVCNIMEIGSGNADRRYCHSNYASTNGVQVSRGSYVSFSLAMNCLAVEGHCEGIELEYSVDFGKTWQILVPPCLPSNPECTNYHPGSVFYSDAHPIDGENKRIIVPIPDAAYSFSTRFRWIQTSATPEPWYLDDVYIGNECPGACLGHGSCHQGQCKCDDGWTGFICQTATGDTATELKDTFTLEAGDSGLFSRIVGGEIDTVCGEIGFGEALRFYKPCSRILETIALNTTKADFVQFKFRTACGASLPVDRDEGVLVDYTTNGGAVWHNLAELYYANHHEKPSFINILLPVEAKTTGTKFRWWQPKHSGLNQSDWALDNILIGGKREEMMLSDDFNVKKEIGAAGLWLDRGEKRMWEFYDNTKPDSFCGRDNIILAGKVPGLDVTISTKDFIPIEGFMIQYTIVVLCEDVQKHHQPVHVQYSTDFGDTWQYIVSQCVPSDRDCFGEEITQPSAHFISLDWRRKTIWIPSYLYGQPVRFRFHQEESDVKWALDRLFIGPACPDACSGHGDCVGVPQDDMFRMGAVNYDVRSCLCDLGYQGPNCYLDFDRNKKFLKDDFNAGENIGNWFIIEPLNTDTRCGLVVDASALAFSGVGPRQAETEELDLRDARFAQHNVIIGGSAQNCLASKHRNDGILMQYSVDGGITWEMLHDLDYESYESATHDYIALPLKARTNATRLRWWQPFEIDQITGLAGMGEDRAGWAIDNTYIGGQEVNAFTLEDDFEVEFDAVGNSGSIDERLYEFYPNGDLGEDQCPGDDTVHMMWPGTSAMYPKQSLTTRQLIVTPGHMIQFKIKVGCTDKVTCSPEFPVRLEFREDPRYDDSWTLVKPACYPASPPSHLCYPYVFHHPSTYKLEYQNTWKRITLPLDYISSDSAQFRWIQDDSAPKLYSWAIDELYIGESCPNFCSGHGKCTSTLECICDDGFIGDDCSQPLRRYVLPVFLETFESESISARMWSNLSGGKITSEGCGPLRHGFSKSVYFYDCGERQLVTREMDLSKAWQIQYVLQFGSIENNKDCRVYQGELYDGTITSTIILQYTTNNGITWHTLRDHWPQQYGVARRLTQTLPSLAKTKTTMLRWWQPTHHGDGYDQWALDNVAIIMTRRQRHLHLLDHERQWRKYGGRQQQLWHPLPTVMNIKSNRRPKRPIEYEPVPPEDNGIWS